MSQASRILFGSDGGAYEFVVARILGLGFLTAGTMNWTQEVRCNLLQRKPASCSAAGIIYAEISPQQCLRSRRCTSALKCATKRAGCREEQLPRRQGAPAHGRRPELFRSCQPVRTCSASHVLIRRTLRHFTSLQRFTNLLSRLRTALTYPSIFIWTLPLRVFRPAALSASSWAALVTAFPDSTCSLSDALNSNASWASLFLSRNDCS